MSDNYYDVKAGDLLLLKSGATHIKYWALVTDTKCTGRFTRISYMYMTLSENSSTLTMMCFESCMVSPANPGSFHRDLWTRIWRRDERIAIQNKRRWSVRLTERVRSYLVYKNKCWTRRRPNICLLYPSETGRESAVLWESIVQHLRTSQDIWRRLAPGDEMM